MWPALVAVGAAFALSGCGKKTPQKDLPTTSINTTNVTTNSATIQWDISNIKLPSGYAAFFYFHVNSEDASIVYYEDRKVRTTEFHLKRTLEDLPKGTEFKASLEFCIGPNKLNYCEIQAWASRHAMGNVELSSTRFTTPK